MPSAINHQPSAISHEPSAIGYRLLVLVGPTAVGKSAMAIELAERLGGEIISADSRYLYRGLDIGTAKPSPADRARAPHHLIDVTDPDRPWSLAEYQKAATTLISEINERQRLPLLVGGTGQYVRAVLDGWTIPKRESDPGLRSELEAFAERDGADALYQRLVEADPAAAASIDKRNVRRVIRALEVTITTGVPFSAQRNKNPPGYRLLLIGLTLPRANLYARIDARIEAMFAAGLVDEVKALAAKYTWTLPALSAIGYRQVGAYLRGEIDLDEAKRMIKHDTRRFVRQQANWFKADDSQIHWYDADSLKVEKLVGDIIELQSK